jgi:adenosylhomocysteinase
LANSGHFDVEIDIPALTKLAGGKVREVRENVVEYTVDGKRLHVLAEGRLVNLSCADGHPASVMDMSFANQALAAEYLGKKHQDLVKGVYDVPQEIDVEVARLKLAALGIVLDPLTPEQDEYLRSWQHGT